VQLLFEDVSELMKEVLEGLEFRRSKRGFVERWNIIFIVSRRWDREGILWWGVEVDFVVDIRRNIVGFERVGVSWIAVRKSSSRIREIRERRRRRRYNRCG
jgi:hypothetical protein